MGTQEFDLARTAIGLALSDLNKADSDEARVKEAKETLYFYKQEINLIETIREIAREEAKAAIKEAFGETG